MNQATFWIVDAFIGALNGRILRGNPTAIVLLDEFGSEAEMLERANEFNLSETAFVVPSGDGNFDLRWMTPQTEVDLCGHATLATARVLCDAGLLGMGATARFATRSGVLMAQVKKEGIELDFPARTTKACAVPAKLRSGLGLDANEMLYCGWAGEDYIVRVAPERLETLRPDFKKLLAIEGRGVIVTTHAPPEEEYDFASRFFGPRAGVDEDPVTGSAHTALAPFWANRLGKKQLRAVQLSQRGGALQVEVRDARVSIIGQTHVRAVGRLCDSLPTISG